MLANFTDAQIAKTVKVEKYSVFSINRSGTVEGRKSSKGPDT